MGSNFRAVEVPFVLNLSHLEGGEENGMGKTLHLNSSNIINSAQARLVSNEPVNSDLGPFTKNDNHI